MSGSYFKQGRLVESTATTATAAATTTLTASSAMFQQFTGTTTQTVVLPDASTLQVGASFEITNRSTASVTVKYNDGSTTADTVAAGTKTIFRVIVASAGNGTWDVASSTSGAGTVTSVAVTVPSGLAVAGSPITSSGTIAITASGQFAASQMPALTGDITTSAGAVATTAAATQANIATLSKATGVAVHGTNTNDDAAAGYVGEYFETVVTTPQNFGSNNQYADLGSPLPLTAGDWDISFILVATVNGAIITAIVGGIGTATGNNSAGLTAANSSGGPPPTAAYDTSVSIPPFRVKLTGNTNYYGKILASYSSGTPKATGRISARRAR